MTEKNLEYWNVGIMEYWKIGKRKLMISEKPGAGFKEPWANIITVEDFVVKVLSPELKKAEKHSHSTGIIDWQV